MKGMKAWAFGNRGGAVHPWADMEKRLGTNLFYIHSFLEY